MSETLIIDLKELETKVENGKGFNHKEATVLLEFVRKIIGNGGTVQPQLTIPKSIADELDSDNLLDFVDRVLTPSDLPKLSARYAYSQTHGDWYNIMVTYLNPLTHDLVKVVEG
ncbi:hypothetical protein B9W73_09520 [Lactococcus lactis]|nr:hypothetical protein B9W73_09520 [Lactococcus lactis]